jgi:diguanylate cyclase (GGDEF)-like protein
LSSGHTASTSGLSASWSTHQLAEFLVAVAACPDENAALACAIQSAAEALEAEVAAVLRGGEVVDSVGFPSDRVPVAELTAIVSGSTSRLEFPGVGELRAIAVTLDDLESSIVLARSGADDFNAEEVGLIRAMARSLSLTLRSMRTLERERSLREEGERRAQENLRLLMMLQERQAFMERLAKIQISISRRAPLPEVLEAIVAGAHELLGDEVVAIRLLDREDPRYMEIMASVGVSRAMLASSTRTPVTEGAGGSAIVEDRLVIIQDYDQSDAAMTGFAGAGLRSAMAAPVHEHGQPMGSIVVASYNAERRYTETEQEMLGTLAHHASIALNDAKAVDQMRQLAYHDSLTGLPNRALFAEHLGRAVANAQRTGSSLAVLFLDIDRFKLVNDSLGHAAGDRLLTAVGQRLRSSLRAADLAARLGGDEFAVLAENTTTDGARALGDVIVEALRDPFLIDGHELAVTTSIGMAVDAGGVTTADSLLRNADLAMYRAKLEGSGGHLLYEPTMHTVVADRVLLEGNLRRAVTLEEFEVHYQPIVWLADGDVVGVEALVRWRREDGTLVAPMEFIPIAEEMGLVVPIGRLVMRESMRQAQLWRTAHADAKNLTLSVNLSARQLHQPELVGDIVDSLASSGFDPSALIVEITETALMHDTIGVSARLHELRALGIRIALDDFGTGYSSLSYLRQFPIDMLKIDKSFISDITLGADDAAVTRAIIDLGRSLHLDVVAEGVETAEQVEALVRMKCSVGQGFYFSRPLPSSEMGRLLQRKQSQTEVPGTTSADMLAG